MLLLTIYGVPQPQGSTRAFIPRGWSRPIITSTNKQLKPWRQEVAGTAKAAMAEIGETIIHRPTAVRVEAKFYFEKPKSAKKSQTHKTTKPDVEKLARALLDALTGICYDDDAQVSECWVSKAFDATPRSVVRVTALMDFAEMPKSELQEELTFHG